MTTEEPINSHHGWEHEPEWAHPFEGIYAKVQRFEKELEDMYPGREKEVMIVLMINSTARVSDISIHLACQFRDSPTLVHMPGYPVELDGAHLFDEVWRDLPHPERPPLARKVDFLKYHPFDDILNWPLEPDHGRGYKIEPMNYGTPRSKKRGRKRATGHAAARSRVICKEAYCTPRKNI